MHAISARKQIRRDILAARVGNEIARYARLRVGDRDGSVGDSRARLVGNATKNASRIRLRMRRGAD